MQETIDKYPIGTMVHLVDDCPIDDSHEVVGYKQINETNYLLFIDGGFAYVDRVRGI